MNQLAVMLVSLLTALSICTQSLSASLSLGGNLMLVNREYLLAANYEPDDLVTPDVKHTSSAIKLRKEAAAALEELFAAAKAESGLTLYAHSGYRSYSTQELIYQRKLKTASSKEAARRLVADPGASEHQLGLAMDIKGSRDGLLNAAFGKSKAGVWLRENAARFGFIIRYEAEWTQITTYAYEPWHIRYVGKEHAPLIEALHIPLEEYVSALRALSLDAFLKGDTP